MAGHDGPSGEERLTSLIRDTGMSGESIEFFRKLIIDNYTINGRILPWREDPSPYRVFVSEIMLQQTQVERVEKKFPDFIATFSGFRELAAAPVASVLASWMGLGYNRRALRLREAADVIVQEHGGMLPSDPAELVKLPGIGKATAASMAVFAYNRPEVFIETNIRAVVIHFFFSGRDSVHDGEILPVVELSLDRTDPRLWYNALMDYGVMLKALYKNPSRRSAHYKRQKPFEGSRRQLRGRLLRELADMPGATVRDLSVRIGAVNGHSTKEALDELMQEGFIEHSGRGYRLREK